MKYFNFGCIFFLMAIITIKAADAETEKLLWENSLKNLKGVKVYGKDVQISVGKKAPSKGATSLKMHFKINHQNGMSWPQVIVKTPDLEANLTTIVEFMFYYTPVKGKIKMLLSTKPVFSCKQPLLPVTLAPNAWHKVRLPLTPAAGKNVKIKAIAFCVGEKANKDKSEVIYYIANLKVISTGKVISPLQTVLTPLSQLERDERQDIEINNLLANPYFKVGGDKLPPRYWLLNTKLDNNISYAKGTTNNGRAIKINSNPEKTVYLRQQGIQLVPGEKYKITGYIRGDNFDGEGGIGIAADAWHKSYVLKFKKSNIKKDWHFFELPFIFKPNRTNNCWFVIYLKKGSKGSVYVDRPILEPLSKRALKESKNKALNDKFDENYAQAKKKGKLKSGPPSKDYKLVWSDEFEGTEIDKTKWTVGNLDLYKKTRGYVLSPQSVKLDAKGCVELINQAKDGIIYQAHLNSRGKYATVYGYFECRLKIHKEDYLNAAFWMMPEEKMTQESPEKTGMEIDIFECIQPSMERLSHTTHWYTWDKKTKNFANVKSGGTVARIVPGLSKGFHTIGFEWTPTSYVFYIDGIESNRLSEKDHPISKAKEYILLTFALARSQREKLKNTGFKSTPFIVDYVRVYKKNPIKGK